MWLEYCWCNVMRWLLSSHHRLRWLHKESDETVAATEISSHQTNWCWPSTDGWARCQGCCTRLVGQCLLIRPWELILSWFCHDALGISCLVMYFSLLAFCQQFLGHLFSLLPNVGNSCLVAYSLYWPIGNGCFVTYFLLAFQQQLLGRLFSLLPIDNGCLFTHFSLLAHWQRLLCQIVSVGLFATVAWSLILYVALWQRLLGCLLHVSLFVGFF